MSIRVSSARTRHPRFAREKFCAELFDPLWDRYRQRVKYVQTYEQVIREAGATFVNDHIAFRTFATQQPLAGIATISRIFEALGYRAAGSYHFDDKQLSAIHFQHPNQQFPKLFISELRVPELPAEARAIIERTVEEPSAGDRRRGAGGVGELGQRQQTGRGAAAASRQRSFTSCRGFCRPARMSRSSTKSANMPPGCSFTATTSTISRR